MEQMCAVENPLISVIVPVYNVDKYMKKCIDSVLNQTYRNIEIILVDDGSTDKSGITCDEYKNKYNNIKVIHKKNGGLGYARNSGLEICKGEYVTFIDSDDWVDSDLILNMYETISTNNADFCKSGFQRVKHNGEVVSIRQYENVVYNNDEGAKKLLPRMVGALPSLHDSIEMCVCAVLYKMEIIIQNNIRFPSERDMISEDLVFNIDYLQNSKCSCTIDKVNYYYRMNDDSLTHTYRKDRFRAYEYFYNEIRKKLEDLNYEKETIIRLDKTFFNNARMSIAQEKHVVSHHDKKTAARIIGSICDNNTLKKVISEYPVSELGFKQKMFIQFVKWKWTFMLYYLADKGLLD